MAKPHVHAESSVRRYGGVVDDYMPIHQLMDSSKSAIADNRHRALTHNSWFISVILEKVFGPTITNSSGRVVAVRDIGEQHVLEDYGNKFIPSAQDFLAEMEFRDWMDNGRGIPPSFARIAKRKKESHVRSESEPDRASGTEKQVSDNAGELHTGRQAATV